MITELQRFVAVVADRHITNTAIKLHLTQSALSQSIARLEKVLHKKLLVQKGKRLELTPEGETVALIAKKILDLWERAQKSEADALTKPTYTIGLFDNAAIRLGKYLKETISKNEYALELIIDSSSNIQSFLQLGTIDIALWIEGVPNIIPKNITCVATFEEKLIPVTAKGYRRPVEAIPFILYQKGSHTRAQIECIFTKARFTPTIYAESTSTTFMKELAALAGGVAFLPENLIKQDIVHKKLLVQSLPFRVKRTYGLYINKESSIPEDLLQDIKTNLK